MCVKKRFPQRSIFYFFLFFNRSSCASNLNFLFCFFYRSVDVCLFCRQTNKQTNPNNTRNVKYFSRRQSTLILLESFDLPLRMVESSKKKKNSLSINFHSSAVAASTYNIPNLPHRENHVCGYDLDEEEEGEQVF